MLPWLQLDLLSDTSGQVLAQVSGSSGERKTRSAPLPGITRAGLAALGASVGRAAMRGDALPADFLRGARDLYRAVFVGERGQILDLLRGQGQGVLVRLMASEPELRAFPWEMMRGPSDQSVELACSTEIRVVRGVWSTEPALPREVRDAVVVLGVAPDELTAAIADLYTDLAPLVSRGAVELQPAALGPAARWSLLLRRLQSAPGPHVLHLCCHGRIREGRPELKLGTEDEDWVSVDLLARALDEAIGPTLRLIYLESCVGADPGALASAAEQLAATAASAVIGHLWVVQRGHARTIAQVFYEQLTGPKRGDVAASLSAARLHLSGTGGAASLGPVLVLRGENPRLLQLQGAGAPARMVPEPSEALPPHLATLLREVETLAAGPCTLIIGDRIDPDGEHAGWKALYDEMARLVSRGGHEPLLTLLQRYELRGRREELRALVSELLQRPPGPADRRVGAVEGLMRLAGPGLVLTSLWVPLVEEALAFHHPEREIVVLHPLEPDGLERPWAIRWDPAVRRWGRVSGPLERSDLTRQSVVVRLHGGRAVHQGGVVGNPVLTEDDQLRNLEVLDRLPNQLLAWLRHHPVGVVGVDPMWWGSRELIRRALERNPLPEGSLAVLNTKGDAGERGYWDAHGVGRGVTVVSFEEMEAALTIW